jgi:hypothetical protein
MKTIASAVVSVALAVAWISFAQAGPIHAPSDEPGKPSVGSSPLPQTLPQSSKPEKPKGWRPEFTRNRPQVPAGCSPAKWDPSNPIYWDLKQVNLVVRVIPNKYETALTCHGIEEQCTNNLVHYSEQERKDYLKSLFDRYNTYREPVRRDKLIRVFSDVLKQKLMPLVVPGPDCKPVDPVVLDLHASSDWEAIERDPAALTVSVELNIVDTTAPPIGMLTVFHYRPDNNYMRFGSRTQWYATAIPLDLPDDQIAARLTEFASHFPVEASGTP